MAASRFLPTRPGVILTAAALTAAGLAAAGLPTPAGATPAGPASGRSSATAAYVDPALSAAVTTGPADALLVLRADDVTATARRAAAAAPTRDNAGPAAVAAAASRAYLAAARAGYAARKAAVTAAVPTLVVTRDFASFPVEQVRVPDPAALARLAADPSIAAVTTPQRYTATSPDDLKVIRQPAVARLGDDGAGTAVAVLDTGVDYRRARSIFGPCPGPRCAVAVDTDFAPDDGRLDDNGHGTNVASLVLRVAPHTRIVAGDVFRGPVAYDGDIVAGLEYVADHAADLSIRAVNLSLGQDGTYHTTPCDASPYAPVFANLIDLGVQPVVAAGNAGTRNGAYVDGVSAPACTPGALAVGATYDARYTNQRWRTGSRYGCVDATAKVDQVTCFSQGGGLVGLLAPGSHETGGGGIPEQSGTSQAAPHVAGAIAALASGDPGDTGPYIASILRRTGHLVLDTRTGTRYPRLDLAAAQLALGQGAVISTGLVGLGVNGLGNLNVDNQKPDPAGNTTYGLRLLAAGYDYTSSGCLCEGWGVADTGTGRAGYADRSRGTAGLATVSFTHTADSARSMVVAADALQVTHSYHPARGTKSLFQVDVTIRNISPARLTGVTYRRVVDWDVEPTPFSELVTLQGGTAKRLSFFSDNGFATANPLVPGGSVGVVGNTTRNGPYDHGALFDLSFGELSAGASITFHEYYGATADEARAIAALKLVGAEAYTLGEPRPEGGAPGAPGTAILAFSGIGGHPIRF